jgi:hypothetical protein
VDAFARLHRSLEAGRDDERVATMRAYFRTAASDDRAIAASLLKGRRMRRVVSATVMRDAALRAAGIPRWLFDASRAKVGDVGETVALVLPPASRRSHQGLAWWAERIAAFATMQDDEVAQRLSDDWDVLSPDARIVYTKLVSGTYRSPVAPALVERALGGPSQVSPSAHPRKAPFRIDAVLVYAEPATPRGFALGAFTFAVWDERDGERTLTPIATIDDVVEPARAAIETIVRRTTVERFGPVRRVTPTLVCELAFDAIEASGRRKSGWRLQSPRVLRVRDGTPIDDAATLAELAAHAAPRR